MVPFEFPQLVESNVKIQDNGPETFLTIAVTVNVQAFASLTTIV